MNRRIIYQKIYIKTEGPLFIILSPKPFSKLSKLIYLLSINFLKKEKKEKKLSNTVYLNK